MVDGRRPVIQRQSISRASLNADTEDMLEWAASQRALERAANGCAKVHGTAKSKNRAGSFPDLAKWPFKAVARLKWHLRSLILFFGCVFIFALSCLGLFSASSGKRTTHPSRAPREGEQDTSPSSHAATQVLGSWTRNVMIIQQQLNSNDSQPVKPFAFYSTTMLHSNALINGNRHC